MTIIFNKDQMLLISTCPKEYVSSIITEGEGERTKASILMSAMIKASKEAEQKDPDWIVCSAKINGLTGEDLNMEFLRPIYGMEDGYQLDL